MKERKNILLFGGKDEALHTIEGLGLNIILIQYPDMLTEFQVTHSQKLIVIEMGEEEKAIKYTEDLLSDIDIDAVVTFYPTWLMTAAYISKTYSIKGNDFDPVFISNYKDQFRKRLDDYNLGNILWRRIKSKESLYEFYREVGKNIIVKPVAGGGSAGVRIIEDEKDIPCAYEYANHVPLWANMDALDSILAEEYILGDEYSVESISHNGVHEILGIVKKITTGAPNFIEIGHVYPAPLDANQNEKIRSVVLNMLEAIGQKEGACHTEVKLFDDQVFIIETQTRFGGDQIWELISMVNGCDAASETAANLTGLKKPKRLSKSKAAAVIHFIPPKCEVVKICGVEDARALPNVIRINIKEMSKKEFSVVQNSADRVGYCLTIGDNSEEALQRCIDAVSNIRIQTNDGIKLFRTK